MEDSGSANVVVSAAATERYDRGSGVELDGCVEHGGGAVRTSASATCPTVRASSSCTYTYIKTGGEGSVGIGVGVYRVQGSL